MKRFVRALKFVLRVYYALVYPVRFQGAENIPAEGAFILCSNHVSARDPIIMLLHLRRDICFMAKKELFKIKFVAAALIEAGAFPVDRGRADLAAIRTSLKVLGSGGGLGIFPQGTRSADNAHTQMHSGAAMIAQRTGAPVIPAYIDGPYRPFRRLDIVFGAQVNTDEFGRKTDSETIARVTDRIEDAIWALEDSIRR